MKIQFAPPGSPVNILVSRDAESAVNILACVLSGRPYVPVDKTYPAERQNYVLQDSGAWLTLDGLTVASAAPVLDRRLPDGSAYVIYTSGSTGRPKGVVVSNRAVCSLLGATTDIREHGRPKSVWSSVHSFAFDFSIWEMWGAWAGGHELLLVDSLLTRDPWELAEFLTAAKVTHLSATPTLLGMLVEADARLADVRRMYLGGEPVNIDDVTSFLSYSGSADLEIHNMYGITESTVHVTDSIAPAPSGPLGGTSIGKALDHLEVSIRDTEGRLLPDRIVGELWVSGKGLATEYLGLPDVTRARFVTDAEGSRHLKTGDLSYSDAGVFYHVGRGDRQVQIRGFRIELGELEACLAGMPGVRSCRAMARNDDSLENLLHVDVSLRKGEHVDARAVIQYVRAHLPAQFVPSSVKIVEQGITTNGKVAFDG
ncbi:nonribosomal peptide synthetase DhbF [Curtobacterium sp. PhB142]|nr:nonribosomal peptide synthetase DhbF [Curtobacterium sp. PhB142]TCM04186.1 nonribosomal peptide synthetase DhbF [Curtobacterium sp. PhB134]TCU50255.1 nonribosomal peptide synthetase DhbF [Curtobacterium sp. PhB146]